MTTSTSPTPDERLRALGLTLPDAPASPPGHAPRPIEPLVVHDSLVFFSGIAPLDVTGVVGTDLTVEQAYEVAGTLALMAMRRIVDAFGSLDAVERWIKVLAFVRSAPGFGDQPAVVNGFSDRVIEVYGTERGRCARSAIGVSDLPRTHPHRDRGDRRVALRLIAGPAALVDRAGEHAVDEVAQSRRRRSHARRGRGPGSAIRRRRRCRCRSRRTIAWRAAGLAPRAGRARPGSRRRGTPAATPARGTCRPRRARTRTAGNRPRHPSTRGSRGTPRPGRVPRRCRASPQAFTSLMPTTSMTARTRLS